MKCLLMLLLLVACGSTPTQDHAPAPIEEGQKRVETMVCGSHEVGENGCIFADGEVSGTLKIFKVYEGDVSIIGLGCGVEYSTTYEHNDEPWLEIDLNKLLGGKLSKDCILTINQRVQWRGAENAPFPIKSFRGTVTLVTCPPGVKCSISFHQKRLSGTTPLLRFSEEKSGRYLLAGCGRDLTPPTTFNNPFSLDLAQFLPNKPDTGCTFILGVTGKSQHKIYRRVWTYSDSVRLLPDPALAPQEKKTYFTVDDSVLAVSVDGYITGRKYFINKPSGNFIRFYTSQGRSLVVFVKDGGIVWAK